jgi:uncharacterized repeat protein (TIGR01451 family)
MMKRIPRAGLAIQAILIAVFLTFIAGTSDAQSADLKVNLVAKKVTSQDGKEKLISADKARPGDVIEYDASYQNTGSAPVRNVGAVVPIPAGLVLVPESANPVAPEASLDGKTFQRVPLTRPVITGSGVTVNEPVPIAEYRALRWNLDEVPAGESKTVTLRARVAANDPKK